MKNHTFLVEIGTEELPAKILHVIAQTFCANVKNELNKANINHGEVQWFASSRRLAVKILEMNSFQSDNNIEKRGPAVAQSFDAQGKPTNVAKCWAHNCGIIVEQADRIINSKGEWLFHKTIIKGQSVQILLPDIVNNALNKLQISKMMRWGNNNIKFIRPIHSIVLLLDDKIIPGNIFGIDIDNIIYGHRFMGNERKISLDHANNYPKLLLEHGWVIADYKLRKKIISRNIEITANQINGVVNFNDDLLNEITALVEWPIVLLANFKKKFLVIPTEILVFLISKEQKCFPIYDLNGDILPKFIIIANIISKNPKKIISGYEKVIQSRLIDIEFFLKIDNKQKLEDHLPHLESMIFHKQLGNIRDKSNRIKSLASWIAIQIGADVRQTERAGILSKCDLLTNMVSEFTDIRGVIGMYYARRDGESEIVSLAQKEHYQPRFSGDILPTTLTSCAVSIADKIDTLVGMFGVNQHLKNDGDPFSLKRITIGIIQIIIEKQLLLDLEILIKRSVYLYNGRLINVTVTSDIINFIFKRLQFWYKEKGYNINIIQSVLAAYQTTQLHMIASRVEAIIFFRASGKIKLLELINKRIINILDQSVDKLDQEIKIEFLKQPEEIQIMTNINILNETLKQLLLTKRYEDILAKLLILCNLINNLFKNVIIMDEDKILRVNRLILLNKFKKLLLQIANVTLLQQ